MANICRLTRCARRVAATVLLGAVGAPFSAAATELGILVPLYSHPCWYDPPNYLWPQVAWAGRQVPVIAIINPDNGPGSHFPDSDYVRGLADLTSGAVVVVGYVYTSYGQRPAAQVLSDAAKYTNSPTVRGIFLDEVDSTTNHLAYYAAIASAIRALPRMSLVILNPGLPIAEEYLRDGVGDIAVMFEDREGWPPDPPSAVLRHHSARRLAMLWLGCPSEEQMRRGVDQAVDRNFGWVYVTDDDLPNPWDSLPRWWSNLVERVRGYHQFGWRSTRLDHGRLRLEAAAVPGRTTVVERASPDPSGPWTPCAVTSAPSSAVMEATVDLPADRAGAYRLRLLPSPTN